MIETYYKKFLLQLLQGHLPLTILTTLTHTAYQQPSKLTKSLLAQLQLLPPRKLFTNALPLPMLDMTILQLQILLQLLQLQIPLTTLTMGQSCYNSHNSKLLQLEIPFIILLQIPPTTLTTANFSYNSYNCNKYRTYRYL